MINSAVLFEYLCEDLELPHGSDLTLYPWDDPSTVARKQLKVSLLKKFIEPNASSDDCDKAALDKFRKINNSCATWQPSPESLYDEYLLQLFHSAMTDFFTENDGTPIVSNFGQILDVARNGPGASVGCDSNDFYTKLFDSNLSVTKLGLYRAYTAHIRNIPTWNEAEETRLKHRGQPCVVKGNRLSFVLKDNTISRVINTEPPLNMFFQLGLGERIETRLKRKFQIDLSTQPDINRRLAYLGSLTDDIVTIDLISASDSMALPMMRRYTPPSFFAWLELLRSPVSTLPTGEELELNMVSTMGNGFTFPLQTAVFCCVVSAAFDMDHTKRVNNPLSVNIFDKREPNWGVFGDDIIVPKRIASRVLRLLKLLGFTPNADKTFLEGPFRESCGFDSWKGSDVRGVYLKSLASPQDRFTAINLLTEWCGVQGIPLVRTIRYLLRFVPRIVVPLWETEDSGIRVPARLLDIVPNRVRRDRNGTLLYKRYVAVSRRYKIGDDMFTFTPRGAKARHYNGAGLMCAFLVGTVENGSIYLRSRVARYSTKHAKAPSWEFSQTMRSPLKGYVGGPGLMAPVLRILLSAW